MVFCVTWLWRVQPVAEENERRSDDLATMIERVHGLIFNEKQ